MLVQFPTRSAVRRWNHVARPAVIGAEADPAPAATSTVASGSEPGSLVHATEYPATPEVRSPVTLGSAPAVHATTAVRSADGTPRAWDGLRS